jgi:hypothetical protein
MMWLFTKYGFFRAVCARQGDGKQRGTVDPKRLMVRARLRKHLEALRAHFPQLLGNCAIREFAGSDYAFRIFVDKSVWSEVLVRLNEEVEYSNFKDEVARFQGHDAYEQSLHKVWSVMYRLQSKDKAQEIKPSSE